MGLVLVAARANTLESTTCTHYLIGPFFTSSFDQIANCLDSEIRCIDRRYGERDAMPMLPLAFHLCCSVLEPIGSVEGGFHG